MFRGREMTHPERGRTLLMRLAEDVKELAVIESEPLQDGRNMVMMLGAGQAGGRAAVAEPRPPADGAGVRDAETRREADEEHITADAEPRGRRGGRRRRSRVPASCRRPP